jgi:hypothetical protein
MKTIKIAASNDDRCQHPGKCLSGRNLQLGVYVARPFRLCGY